MRAGITTMTNLKQQLSEQHTKIQQLQAELQSLQCDVPEITVRQDENPLEFLKQKLHASKLIEEQQRQRNQIQVQLEDARASSQMIQQALERHRRAALMGFDRLKQAAQRANMLLDEAREAIEEIERLGAALSQDYAVTYDEFPVYSTLGEDYFFKQFPYVEVGDRSVTLTTQEQSSSQPQSAA